MSQAIYLCLFTILLNACFGKSPLRPNSKASNSGGMSSFSINGINVRDYDEIELSIATIESPEEFTNYKFVKGDKVSYPILNSGNYVIELSYYNTQNMVFSSKFCSHLSVTKKMTKLKPGHNELNIKVCDPNNASTMIGRYLGNVARGKSLYEKHQCASCHESYNGDLYQDLTVLMNTISDDMPPNDEDSCFGQCAADITAYVDRVFLVNQAVCNEDKPVLYGSRELKLLTSYEYQNSVQDLFPNATVPPDYLKTLGDISIGKFPNNYKAAVTGSVGDKYFANAQEIAAWAIENQQPFSCTNKTTCAQKFMDEFASKAFRRPLKEDRTMGYTEKSDFENLFMQAGTASEGLSLAIVATLISPHFVYRSELGTPVSEAMSHGIRHPLISQADSTAYVLDAYEYASALSYMYTGSLPDNTLLQAAAKGDLDSEDLILKQIDRMIDSPKGEKHFKHFAKTWMQTDDLFKSGFKRENPALTLDVRQSMEKEVEEFFWHIFSDEKAPFSEFYSANYTFLNSTLSNFYGIPGGSSANSFQKVSTMERGGIVTTGAFLTSKSHPDQTAPILRAVGVREMMLCHHIDPPPSLAIEARDELTQEVERLASNGELTTRTYFEKVTNNEVCAACHEQDINPLGGGMEDFDFVGLPRRSQLDIGLFQNQLDINSEGTIFGLERLKGQTKKGFNGAKELSQLLGTTEAVKSCFVEKSFRFSTGRAISPLAMDKISKADRPLTEEELEDFQCVSNDLMEEFETNNQSPKALFRKMGLSDIIRFRR